jgi:NAD(P)-dependent dehydrogenase (short-subunit alcohol dehydrogenase family)
VVRPIAVLFDLDGTLVDTLPFILACVRHTFAEEARRPHRDVPIGILASLIICTVLYIAVSAVLTGMVERRDGRIVNVSSIHGTRGDANVVAHSAAKFGLIGMTQALAREFRAHNITVNAVCPGTVENRKDEGEGVHAEPLAEKLWPRDVAKAVLFLASDDAAGITGSALEIFGGTDLVIQP